MSELLQKTRPAKVAECLLGHDNPLSGLYGPFARRIVWFKDSDAAKCKNTRPKRNRFQVRMVAFEWKGAIQACRENKRQRFIRNERG